MKPQDVISLTIAMPAFCEAQNMEAMVMDVIRVVSRRVDDYEIIVVADGSLDETPELICRVALPGVCAKSEMYIPYDIFHERGRDSFLPLIRYGTGFESLFSERHARDRRTSLILSHLKLEIRAQRAPDSCFATIR